MNNPQTCLTCENGYELSGYNCIKQNNFGFKLQLDTDLPSFYQSYSLFLKQLASTLDYDTISSISIKDIRSGSVNITGSISAQD